MKLVGVRSGGPWAKLRYERHWATITMKSYEVIFQNFFKLTSKILRKRSGVNTSTMRGRAWFSDLRFKSRSHHFTNEVLVQYSSCLGGSRYASLCMLYEDMHCGFFTIPLLRHPSVLFDKAPLAFTFYRHESYNKARSQSNEETPKVNTVANRGTRVPSLPLLQRADKVISNGYHPCPVPAESYLPTALVPLSGYCADL